MAYGLSKFDEVNVLASKADWAWPLALRNIFEPRGVNLIVAKSADEFVNVIEHRRIHATIIDNENSRPDGLATIKIIKMSYPLIPSLLLSNEADEDLLEKALGLGVFSVIAKPVDLSILRKQLDKLFMKVYNCDVFAA